MKRFSIWAGVTLCFMSLAIAIIYALQETGKALGTVKVDPTIAIVALVICAIILIAQVISRAGAKHSLPVDRYIITNEIVPTPRGVVRLDPDKRITGDFLMVMAAKSEARGFGRELGGKVEIEIKTEPLLDTEAVFALEYLRRNNGRNGIEVK